MPATDRRRGGQKKAHVPKKSPTDVNPSAATPADPPVRATITDVAGAAGVNVSTASRVLRGDPAQRVRAETRERIIEAAQRLKYEPSIIARALRGARSFSLAIVVPQLDNPVFGLAIQGAERAAWQRGYSLLTSHEHERVRGRSVYEGLVDANRVDGLVVASLEADATLVATLRQCGVPFVLFNRRSPTMPHCIALDGRAAARLAVSHLVELGHRRIAHLSGRPEGFNGPDRAAGFNDALLEAGIPLDPSQVIVAGYTAAAGAMAMRTLLDRPGPLPTAIVATTTIAAAGALAVLHERGIAVPHSISIVGIHDLPIAEMLYPPLTTVRLPTEAMGYEAALAVIDLIEGRRSTVGRTLAPEGMALRGSTAPPPR